MSIKYMYSLQTNTTKNTRFPSPILRKLNMIVPFRRALYVPSPVVAYNPTPMIFPNHISNSLFFLNSFNTCCVSLRFRKLFR